MKMVKLSALFVSFITILGTLPAEAQTNTLSFQCGEGSAFEAKVEKNRALVKLDGRTLELLPVDSRIGRKFSNGRTLFYVNENQAFIEVDYIRVHSQCMASESSPPISSSKQLNYSF